jgi:aldose 1-epimerase
MAESALPLTGTQHGLAAGDYQAVVTELGAGLRGLSWRGQPIVAGYDADELPPGASGDLLLPWPNRIDHGLYEFGGRSYQLDISEPATGNAIHGLTRWASWNLVAAADDRIELGLRLLGRTGYPFSLELRASYAVSAKAGLEVTVTARNVGSRPAPYGTGSHPYLRASPAGVDGCELQLPAGRWLPADARGIPSGPPQDVAGTDFDFRARRLIGATSLDHAFTGLTTDQQGRAWATLTGPEAEVALWAGPGYRWLQAFTGDTLAKDARRRALAVEPMTCPPNAFVTGADLLTLAPGDATTHRWGLQARQPG